MLHTSRRWRENPLILGNHINGRGPVRLSAEARRTHTYIAGASGTGKSKLLEYLIRQDLFGWPKHRCGMLVLDPHGALYKNVMRAIAAHRHTDWPIVPIDLSNPEYVVSYNPLRQGREDPAMVARSFVDAMAYAWGETGTDKTPLFENWALELLLALYQTKLTLAEAPQVMSRHDPSFRRQLVPHLTGPVRDHWKWACQMQRREFSDESGSTIRRMKRFETSNRLRLMLGTGGTSFDFRTALDEGWIVLVNLSSEGGFGDPKDADTLATLMLSDLWMAASDRGKDEKKNRPFRVYIDEFQRFITPTIAENLAQARGFGLQMTLATQFPLQLLSKGMVGESILNEVMGNVETMIVFGMRESKSLRMLAEWLFFGALDPDEVKEEIWATRAVGQEKVELEGWGEVDTGSHSAGRTYGPDHEEESYREQDSDSHASAHSSHEAFKTIYSMEKAGTQFRPLEEQLFKHMQKLFMQDKRCAFMRTASMRCPISLRTQTIKEGLALGPYMQRRTNQLLEKLPFVYRSTDAVEMIEKRQEAFRQRVQRATQEPVGSGRVVKRVASQVSDKKRSHQ